MYIADEIVLEKETIFDQTIMRLISSIHSAQLTSVMIFLTFFGSHTFLFPAYLVLIVILLIKKNIRLAIEITAIGLTSTAILFSLKDIFQRVRPLDP